MDVVFVESYQFKLTVLLNNYCVIKAHDLEKFN